MNCTRCSMSAEAVMCSNCYRENSSHNQPTRDALMQRYATLLEEYDLLVREKEGCGNRMVLENRKGVELYKQKWVRDEHQRREEELKRKKKENSLMRERLKAYQMYLLRLNNETQKLRILTQQKVKKEKGLDQQIKRSQQRLKEQLQTKFNKLIGYLQADRFECSKSEWQSFINMEEEASSMYVILMQGQCQQELNRIHAQIHRQMVVLASVSQLLAIQLPYKVGLKLLLSNASTFLIIRKKEGKTLNKTLLREFHANTLYLFSRFNIMMEYPRIEADDLSLLLARYVERRLNISNFFDSQVLTRPVYVSSYSMSQSQNSKENTISTITGSKQLQQLCVQSLVLSRFGSVPPEQLQQPQESTQVLQLAFTKSFNSDEQIQILQ